MGADNALVTPLRAFLKKVVPDRYHKRIAGMEERTRRYRIESYSQFGEDLTLRWLFERISNGFYVDVGAYHPKRFSNTYYFYKRGWTGINVDATRAVIDLFKKARPKDINLPYAVAKSSRETTLYLSASNPGTNTLSPEFVACQAASWRRRYASEMLVKTHTLAEILDAYKPDDRPIQFVSVDAEGLDLEVLESNNWEKYIPNVVLCEDLAFGDTGCWSTSKIWTYLNARGYVLFAKCVHTLVFVHRTCRTSKGGQLCP